MKNSLFKMKGFPTHATSAFKQSTDDSKKIPVHSLSAALIGPDITKTQFNNASDNFRKENPGKSPVNNYKLFQKYLRNEGVTNPPDSINVMRTKKKTT